MTNPLLDRLKHHVSGAIARGTATPIIEQRAPKPKLTGTQKRAFAQYRFRLREEDRYLGSVFVTPHGQRAIEEKTRAAYEECKRLGMDHTHGL